MTENKKVNQCEYCQEVFKSRATAYRHRLKCKVEAEKNALQDQTAKEVEMKDKVISEMQRNNKLEEQVTALQQENQAQNHRINSLEMQLSSLKDMMQMVLQNTSHVSQPPTQVITQTPAPAPAQAPVKPFSVEGYLNDECNNALSVQEVQNNFKTSLLTYLEGDTIKDIPRDETSLIKWVINKSLQGIQVDNFPIRCSSKHNKHFWGKKDDSEGWVKGFDVMKHFYIPMCYAIISLINSYKKKNPNWIENERMVETLSELFTKLCNTMDKEEYIKKSKRLLIEKTIIVNE